jgi:hypothetical protein
MNMKPIRSRKGKHDFDGGQHAGDGFALAEGQRYVGPQSNKNWALITCAARLAQFRICLTDFVGGHVSLKLAPTGFSLRAVTGSYGHSLTRLITTYLALHSFARRCSAAVSANVKNGDEFRFQFF